MTELVHFRPTSASWLNLVERFFAEITAKRIRRGSYTSVGDLDAAIYDYLLQHTASSKRFTWNKSHAAPIPAGDFRAHLPHPRGHNACSKWTPK